MNATIKEDMTCLPEPDRCTRRGPGHYESPRQLQIAREAPGEWRYGRVRHAASAHVTVIDFDDSAEPVALWRHRDSARLLTAGTLVALHGPAQLLMVKKVLAHRISVLVLGTPGNTPDPVEWHPREAAVDTREHATQDVISVEAAAAIFRRLTQVDEQPRR